MKSCRFVLLARMCLVPAFLCCLGLGSVHSLAAPATPSISSITFDKADVIVSVTVAADVKKVTLESRSRLGSGAWVPRAVLRTDGTGAALTFRLPRSAQAEILRVRADADEPLPASFYAGTNSFVAGTGSAGAGTSLTPTAGDGVTAQDPTAGAAVGNGTETRDVVESDIWKVTDHTLYFFNQYRGLQVIDLSVPDAPLITGTFALPAAGEQMYVLDDKYVLLLAHIGCSYGSGDESQVLVLDVSGGVPQQVASLSVPGWIQESRLVGTALYVASQAYQPVTGGKSGDWEPGSVVSSFDLANPAHPVTKDTLWYAGYGNVIYATDQYLFIVTQSTDNWWQSILNCIDISAPDGAMKARSSITTAGRVPDKFKINQNGDILSVIAENWNTGGASVITTLETFSLLDASAPVKLGRLELARREQLHAARFDGNLVYVVTFFQMDPLWIVDLSDPATPRIAGELQVPGWSTYIQPLGDRLVSIGISDTNDWRVAVSLFDVRDPAHPALLSKVPLGINNSWSEANNDEKAFQVLPDSGLILVPYEGYETNGYASRVQLIDLGADSLKARGTIDHSIQPRRATLHNNRIYSISGKELLAVDAADRDHPVVRDDVELSWSVDRVFLAGDYVLELANGDSWYGWWSQGAATPPSIRVSKASDPDHALSTLVLTNYLPVIGAAVQDGKLYLAQGASGGIIPLPMAAADSTGGAPDQTNLPTLFLTVLGLGNLPEVQPLGQTAGATASLGWGAALQPVWPKPGLLVWTGGGGGWGPILDGGIAVGGGVAVAPGVGIARPWWGGNGGRFFAFDVSAAATPTFVSELDLTTNAWWSFSSVFVAANLLYVSHEASEFVEGVTLPDQPPPAPVITVDKDTGMTVTNQQPVGIWVQRYYLDVVDYADATAPTVRQPVNIPGQLNGISKDGSLLYTVAPHWVNWKTDWAEWLDASAYDGVSASLVNSLPLPTDLPHPLLIKDGITFLGRPDNATGTGQVETWSLSDSGKFGQLGALKLGSIANSFGSFGNLLAVQQNAGTLIILDATSPSSLSVLGKGTPTGCLGYDLTRGDASVASGLWLPLGDYGVARIPIGPGN